MRRGEGDRGSVTAEFAVVLPAIVLVVVLGTTVLGSAARVVRLQDAAADAARVVARGEGADAASGIVRRAVGGGAARVEERGELVCVTASAPAPALPLLTLLPPLTASSCALAGGR